MSKELWRTKKIDNIDEVSEQEATLENLRILSSTACPEAHGRGADRVLTYRLGFATPIANIEKSCWRQLATDALTRSENMGVYETVKNQMIEEGKQRSVSAEDFEILVLKESINRICGS